MVSSTVCVAEDSRASSSASASTTSTSTGPSWASSVSSAETSASGEALGFLGIVSSGQTNRIDIFNLPVAQQLSANGRLAVQSCEGSLVYQKHKRDAKEGMSVR